MAKKLAPTDGLGPKEIKRIRAVLRQVWQQCYARKLVIQRCTDKNGWTWCEQCRKKTPKLKVDHIEACGDVDSGYLKRLFVPSKKLQGLCPKCHNEKTKMERAELRKLAKAESEW